MALAVAAARWARALVQVNARAQRAVALRWPNRPTHRPERARRNGAGGRNQTSTP